MFLKLTRHMFSSSWLAILFAVLAFSLPLATDQSWWLQSIWLIGPCLIMISCILNLRIPRQQVFWTTGLLIIVLVLLWLALTMVHDVHIATHAAAGFWCFVIALGLSLWHCMARLSAISTISPLANRMLCLLIPALFGIWLISLWELVVIGFGVPHVLLPAPSIIGEAFSSSMPTLAADFRQTFIKAVIPGFILGNSVGFLVALLADRVPFLRRGLLPVGNLVSAIPIVGIAPIMVMWFGFDWQSKAAVVVIMTFFPMLVNAITGLGQSDKTELDLMRSYGASYWQAFCKLRLPYALPFIFNALKINSTLALIGAIVAEFFGTPIVGMGFRISTEVGRMNIEMVWASIAVAALSGSIFYGLLALLERWVTFWHASFRQ